MSLIDTSLNHNMNQSSLQYMCKARRIHSSPHRFISSLTKLQSSIISIFFTLMVVLHLVYQLSRNYNQTLSFDLLFFWALNILFVHGSVHIDEKNANASSNKIESLPTKDSQLCMIIML